MPARAPRTVGRLLSETNCCNGSDRTVTIVIWIALRFSQTKHTTQKKFFLCILNWAFCNSSSKWLPTGSGNSATQIPKRLPRDSEKFLLKESSANSTYSLIELLSESETSEEEYSTFLLPLQWVLLQNKGKYSPEICLYPAASIIMWRYWLTTVRPYGNLVVLTYGDLVVLSKYREGVLYLGKLASSNPLAPVRGCRLSKNH